MKRRFRGVMVILALAALLPASCSTPRSARTPPANPCFESIVEGPTSLQPGDQVLASSPITGSVGWAVGTTDTGGSLVAFTDDGGSSWRVLQRDSAGFALRAVDFLDVREGWVAGGPKSAGLVLHTVDGGRHWTSQSAIEARALTYIRFTDRLHGTVGNSQERFTTDDGGATWVRER